MDNKLEIKMIQSGLPMDGSYFEVGVDGVTKILDKSAEYEDRIEFFYLVFKGDIRVAEWVNIPVKITYFEPKATESTESA